VSVMIQHTSTRTVESEALPGVRFTLRRMSFASRVELMKSIREAARELEYRQAGDGLDDKLAAALSSAEVDRLYLRWGLVSIQNLSIDGTDADPDLLMERGPEALCREIVAQVRSECGLSDEERKN
jgi:hypothetical protein